jgi:Methyltransferase domain
MRQQPSGLPMTDTNSYAHFARYYERLQGSSTDDIDFFLRAAERVTGPILELGAGSGRVMAPLVRAGHHVIGLESEPAMMALAVELVHEARHGAELAAAGGPGLPPQPELVQGSMTAFSRPERFELALFSHNTFAHLSGEEMAACIRCVASHLAVGGTIIFDMSNPFALAAFGDDDEPVYEESWLADHPTSDRALFSQSRHDADQQRVTICWHFRLRAGGAAAAAEHSFQFDLQYLFPHEWEELLAASGLSLQALYGDYDHSPFDEQSARLLVVASALSDEQV